MKKIDIFNLQKLIKSLKKEEKRSFKLSAQKYSSSKENVYIQIFNYLDKAALIEKDKSKFKAKFKHIKGLSGIQKYLYLQIMKNLRASQKAKKDNNIALLEGLKDLEILFSKELIYIAQEKLEELLSIAIVHDKIIYLPLLYEWWFKLGNTRFRYYNVSASVLENFIQQYDESIENLKLFHTYRTQLARVMIIISNKNSRQITQRIKILEQNIPTYYTSGQKDYSLSIALEELQLRKYIASLLRDKTNVHRLSSQTCQVIKEQAPVVFETYRKHYYKALYTQMTSTNTIQDLIPILEKLTTAIQESPNQIDSLLQVGIAITRLEVAILTKDTEQSLTCIENTEQLIQEIKKTSPSLDFSIWYYKVALYYFTVGEYDNTLDVIIAELDNNDIPTIIKNNSIFLKIIICYERKEYIFLASFLSNFRRSLRNKDSLLQFEQLFLSLMTKLTKIPFLQHQALLVKTKEEMLFYFQNASNPEKEMLTFFNYVGWIDSQINKTPLEIHYFRHVGTISF